MQRVPTNIKKGVTPAGRYYSEEAVFTLYEQIRSLLQAEDRLPVESDPPGEASEPVDPARVIGHVTEVCWNPDTYGIELEFESNRDEDLDQHPLLSDPIQIILAARVGEDNAVWVRSLKFHKFIY